MTQLLFPFLVSFFITVLTTPLTIKFAKRYGLIDDPKLRPHPAHIQNRIIARAGGLPIYLAIIISILVFIPLAKSVLGIILGITILLILGLMDDRLRNFSPFPRLIVQFLVALVVVASGVGITFITNPLGGVLRLDELVFPFVFFSIHNIIVFADLFALFWIVWMMNMVNWSNGVDGQTPAILAAASFTIGLLALRLYLGGDQNQLLIAMLSFITAGASLGFLIFNWHPAKIIPGFSGNGILGFMIAVLSILAGAKLATALLVLLIPSIDFFYTFFRRILAGKSPFFGDQKHLHHLLLNSGFSHQQIALIYFLSSAILGFAAINLSPEGKLFTVAGAGTIVLAVILWLHLFRKQEV